MFLKVCTIQLVNDFVFVLAGCIRKSRIVVEQRQESIRLTIDRSLNASCNISLFDRLGVYSSFSFGDLLIAITCLVH